MEKRGPSLTEIQDVPKNNLILLTGPPGIGKSTFCHQIVLNGIAAEKPVIFITTEQSSSAIAALLRERGMGEVTTGALGFVDAFTQLESIVKADSHYVSDLDNALKAYTLDEKIDRSLYAQNKLLEP